MHLTSYLQEGTLTIVLTGEIDHHSAKQYMQSISSKIEAYSPKICVLDYSEVSFMDSSGIAIVINALRNMKKIDGKLILSGLNQQPIKVFHASGVEKLVNIKEEIK